MRLDVYLATAGYTKSRENAKRLILAGSVTVDGRPAVRPAQEISGDHQIFVMEDRYVSRGGLKLEAALKLFDVSPDGLRAIDIGASTGGFTDCLLQHGATFVVAVDAGAGQLDPKLRADSRVRCLEKTNARTLSVQQVGQADLVVMDVSFISQTYILPQIPQLLLSGARVITLIKPQFEAGREALGKQGIVRSGKDRVAAVRRVTEAAAQCGLYCVGLAPSPILGGSGNEEFLSCFSADPALSCHEKPDIEEVVMKGAVIV